MNRWTGLLALWLALPWLLLAEDYQADDLPDDHMGMAYELEEMTAPIPLPVNPYKPMLPFMLSISPGLQVEQSARPRDDIPSTVTRESLTLRADCPTPTLGMIGLSFQREYSQYRETVDAPGTPFSGLSASRLSTARFGLNHRLKLNDSWSVMSAGNVTYSVENGVAWNDSRTYGGLFSGRYQATPTLGVMLGIFAHTQMEDKTRVWPIPGLDWRITDRLTLITTQGATLAYDLTGQDRWLAECSVLFDQRTYKLDGDAPYPNGYIKDRQLPLITGIKYRPAKWLYTRLQVGATLWQEYQLENAEADTVERRTDNPGVLAEWSAGLTYW